jgi:mannose-1-phosphate guanylyltransferase
VLLAGGDGVRLRDLTAKIAGEPRPKQFCRIVGDKSLFSETRARLEPLCPLHRQVFVMSRAHERFYRQELTDADSASLIAQPLNRGTAVAMTLALLHILRRDPGAVVGFFPCDHYYANEDSFRMTILSAAESATKYPESIVLVAAKAEYPEIDYGWIEPGSEVSLTSVGRLFRVRRFWEKPRLPQAQELWRKGCLWNTFVIVGGANAVLDLLCSQIPETTLSIMQAFADDALENAYRHLPAVDFSRDALAREPHRLLVLCDGSSGWADLGSPTRVFEILTRNGIQPAWAMHTAGQVDV